MEAGNCRGDWERDSAEVPTRWEEGEWAVRSCVWHMLQLKLGAASELQESDAAPSLGGDACILSAGGLGTWCCKAIKLEQLEACRIRVDSLSLGTKELK